MKKILSLTLVLVLVLSSFSMAFASAGVSTSFSDVNDEDVALAVDRLSAFGIVDGYTDGSYKPEGMVTRAEFSKLLVTALGLENAAEAAKGSSQFTDVTGTEWYAGFVNVAAGQGVVGGYPDGTFKPNAQVTYGEAVTMLVRALGYKDEFLPGTWPSNYVAKAASLDITDDVKFFATGYADRGSVAVLLNNTLDAKIIEQDSYGDENNWSESKTTTLLEDKLSYDVVGDGATSYTVNGIIKVKSSLDDDEFAVNDVAKEAVSNTVLAKAESLFGLEVVYYTNDDNEVVYIEKSDEDNSKVLFNTIDQGADYMTFASDSIANVDITLLDQDGNDTDYEVSENVTIYVDNEELDEDDLNALNDNENTNEIFGRFVIGSSNEVVLMDLHQFDESSKVVVSSDSDSLTYFDDDEGEITIDTDDYDAGIVITDVEGNVVDIKDLEKNDVIYLNENNTNGNAIEDNASGDAVLYVVVVRNAVTGEADRYRNDEFRVDGTDYDVKVSEATLSVDENDNVTKYDSSTSDLNDITASSEDVMVLLNLVGDVRHISSDVQTSSDNMYGVIDDIDWSMTTSGDNMVADGVSTLTILNQSGDLVDYKVDLDDNTADYVGFTKSTELGFEAGQVLEFTTNSDGEIDFVRLAATVAVDAGGEFTSTDVATASGSVAKLTDDFEANQVELDSDYVVDSDVVVFDLSDGFSANTSTSSVDTFDGEDASVVDYKDLVGDGTGKEILILTNSDDEIVMIGLLGSLTVNDATAAYATDFWVNDGDLYTEVVLTDGSVEEYLVDNAKGSEIDGVDVNDSAKMVERAISFTYNSDGTIDVVNMPGIADVAGDDFSVVVGQVIDKDGSNKFKVNTTSSGAVDVTSPTSVAATGTWVYDNSDTMYYITDDTQKISNVDIGDYVYVILDGKYAVVVQEFDTNAKFDNTQAEEYVKAWNAVNPE